jgi:sugar lactone lactonase YvrE
VVFVFAFMLAAGGRAQSAASPLMRPVGVASDAAGDLFVADAARNQVFEIAAGGVVSIVAGNGTQGFSGDGGAATAAELNAPSSAAVGGDGTLYIADSGNQRVRAVQAGTITTFAGNGTRGFTGDGGLATAASLDRPVGVAIDSTGALLVCDQGNERVRRISGGVITTVAGAGLQGFAGDGAAATAAELNEPSGVVASADGRIFIADAGNQRVRVVGANGIISTFAGSGKAGSAGDGGPAMSAQLSRPVAVAIDSAGDLLVADEDNHRLRRIANDGTISTIAGTGTQGAAPDGSVAMASAQNLPTAAAVSGFGWPILADAANGTVQILFTDGKLYAPAGLSSRTTSLTTTAPAAIYGAASSSVSVSASPASAQGTVQISESGTVLATGTLAQGSATVELPSLGVGPHTLTASYLGDGLHPSATGTASVQIAPAPVTATAAPVTVSYGAAIPSLSGTVTGVLPQDQGNVTVAFTAGAPPMPQVGTYPIAASLTGPASANYTASIAPDSGRLMVVPAQTVVTVTPPAAAYATLPLQLTARVASTTSGTPSGTVEFLDGATVIATAPLINGAASAVELSPASGGHSFSVAYSGDSNFRASTSAPLLQAVNALPDFTVALAGNSEQSVISGATANYALTVASEGSPFTGAVTLSASGVPAGSTVSFSPPAVVPGASKAAVTMTVSTSAMTARRRNSDPSPELAVAICGGLLLVTARRRRMLRRLLVVLVAAGIFDLAGCGARTASEAVLPVQSFTIRVQATGTNLAGNVVQHTVNVTLAIQ